MRQRRPIQWRDLGRGGTADVPPAELPARRGGGEPRRTANPAVSPSIGPADGPQNSPPSRAPGAAGSPAGTAIAFATTSGPPDLVGCFDPLDGTVLEAGERVVVCLACGTGYHSTSWDFLLAHNAGACCNCKRSSDLTFVVLEPARRATREAVDERGGIVRLEDLRNHVNLAVVFEGRVVAHQISAATGTHFIKFHQDRNPFKGFKLVIFASEVYRWERLGIDPASYVGQTIQVRGLLKDHPRYGLEILPKSPSSIRVVSNAG